MLTQSLRVSRFVVDRDLAIVRQDLIVQMSMSYEHRTPCVAHRVYIHSVKYVFYNKYPLQK